MADIPAIEVNNLDFSFGGPQILRDVTLKLPRGSRCLLVGANGAGKSTLLRLLAGKRLSKGDVKVFGKNAFHEAPPGITYLGTEWAGNPIVRRDVPVSRLLKSMGAERNRERCLQLLDIMDVNVEWRMHEVSDGERRRVQTVLGLMEPWELLLLDEVTTDLDVLVRTDLLNFLKIETEARGCTIVYATHIFDGLGAWPTHVAHIHDGHIDFIREVTDEGFPELVEARQVPGLGNGLDNSALLRVVEKWLRKDYEERKKKKSLEYGKERPKTRWEQLSDNWKEHFDKYYDYSHDY
ncbi:P-loop containing nucleoside triphosphate hydrolase protein [Cladochytrium replicatum]|nr:P-loop containing nucleoside triphosphate hydrolase protein [Cladochytrium replicatum]